MSRWVCPEVLLVLTGVILILADALIPAGKKGWLPRLAILLSSVLFGITVWQSGQPMPEAWATFSSPTDSPPYLSPFSFCVLSG